MKIYTIKVLLKFVTFACASNCFLKKVSEKYDMKYFFLFLGDYCIQEYRGDTVLRFEKLLCKIKESRDAIIGFS